MHVRVLLARYRAYLPCPDCQGTRLKPDALHYRIEGKNIAQVNAMSVGAADDFLTVSKTGGRARPSVQFNAARRFAAGSVI